MRRYVAEGLGTFTLVFAGVGTAVFAGALVGAVGVALAFGLALLVLVYVIGPISGSHVNPAVTLGMLLCRKIEPRRALGYVIAQCIGAIVAAAAVWLIASSAFLGYSPSEQGLGANGYGAYSPGGFGAGGVFLTEVLVTALLVFTVLAASDVWAPFGVAAIPIGLALGLGNLIAIPVDNASVNPARSLGPAVFAGGSALGQLWMFIVAPLVGAAVAALAYRVLRPWPQVRPATAERPLPEDATRKIAEETARLIGARSR